jgi:drug/metabolite transporter (DMT)-like permease
LSQSGSTQDHVHRPAQSFAGSQFVGYACGAGAALIWGVQAVISRQSVGDGLTAADVTILRFLTASAALLPLALMRLKPFPVGRLGWPKALVLTLFAGAPFSLVLVGGSTFAPALHTAVIAPGLIPVLAALLAYFVLGETPPAMRLVGLALILAGIGLFFWTSVSGPVAEGVWRGDLLFALAALMWSLFGLLARKWHADALDLTITLSMLSVVLMPLLALVVPIRMGSATLPAIALQAIYQGLLVGVASVFFYAKANAVLGSARAALFLPLVPAVTLTAGAVLLGETPSWAEIAGMAIVMTGMTVALRADRPA